MIFRASLFCLLFAAVACQTGGGGHVMVHESYPRGDCRSLGQVIGHSGSRDQARNKSIEDMKQQASRKGANYVQLVAVTAHGGAARGIAFRCR